MWTAAYWRYKVRETREFEEEHEAVNFLMGGEEYGELSSEAVLRDGAVVYDHAALHELFSRLDWKPMPPTIDGIPVVRRVGP